MRSIEFVKMSGCGNDFVMVDAVGRRVPADLTGLSREVCARRTGVGADGLVVLGRGKQGLTARIFNSDGSEAEMCGNAARCVAKFAQMQGHAGKEVTFQTIAGTLRARMRGTEVEVQMTPPSGMALDVPVDVDGVEWTVSFINTGVPHVVIFVKDVSKVDVERVGRVIRFHRRFAPAGTNADFVEVRGASKLAMRTYERGVEGETLACGTGAVAAAAVARHLAKVKANKVTVAVPGGRLVVGLEFRGHELSGATLTGEARVVYRGVTEQVAPEKGRRTR